MFFEQEIINPTKREAVALFNEAYQAQMAKDYEAAIKLYKRSIEIFPTAEALTFLAWVYSFEGNYELAIAECLAAIAVDATFGNPYNDIGSYLIAKGNYYDCVRCLSWPSRQFATMRAPILILISDAFTKNEGNCSKPPGITGLHSMNSPVICRRIRLCGNCRKSSTDFTKPKHFV